MQSKVTYRLEERVVIFEVQLFLQSTVLLTAKLEESQLGQWLTIQYFHHMLQTKVALPKFCLEEWHIEVELTVGQSLKVLYLPILENQHSHIEHVLASVIETLESDIKQATRQTTQEELSLTNQIAQATNNYSQLCDNWRSSQRRKQESKDQLKQLNQEVMKLNKQIVALDEDILRGKRGLELERYRADTKGEKIEERKRKVYLSELAKLNHPKVQKVVKDSIGLQRLDLSQCDLKFMKFVQVFPQVQELYLSSNAIKRMEGLGGLAFLRKLDLAHNFIEKIDGLSNSLELRDLNLQSNKIVKLENLFHLSRLEILSLSNNQLEEIPRQIKSLDALIEFKVINNALAFLPWQLTNLRKLRTFSLLGNPCFRESNRSRQVICRLVQQQVQTCCGTP